MARVLRIKLLFPLLTGGASVAERKCRLKSRAQVSRGATVVETFSRARYFYQLVGTTRSAKQIDAAALSEVVYSVTVMFDFRLERWLDIAMPAPWPDLNVRRTENYKAIDEQPAFFVWQRSTRCGLNIERAERHL